MYINDNRKEKTVPYGQIKIGDTFFDVENEIHAMKIIDCEDSEGCVNAINLQEGNGLYYEDDEEVVAIKARIEIYA